MSVPHTSWAEHYDAVYELSFGSFYDNLSQDTLQMVKQIASPPARVIDFGAGTGRLSIPLAAAGYAVTAVEPCQAMLDRLEAKAHQRQLNIATVCQRMQDYQPSGQYDVALCVFSILSYLLDDAALDLSIQAAARSLRHGGALLIDVPCSQLYRNYHITRDGIDRDVQVTPKGGGIYEYCETTRIKGHNGIISSYTDTFPIRCWSESEVLSTFAESGFVIEKDLSQEFFYSGAHYYLLRKEGEGAKPEPDPMK